MRRAIRGFSLVELLVVVAVISIFMGLIGYMTSREQRDGQVRAAAEELTSVLRRTRQRAIADRRMYAVAFNIQNEPGSSGAVLNNRSGGHWYRVIGPSLSTRYMAESADGIPWAKSQRYTRVGGWGNTNFPDFIQDVEACWIEEAHLLPARKVRFLALGDTDEGPRLRQKSSTVNAWYGAAGETTYPRPWFGYFDEATHRLWPWGGYDPIRPTSGFYYQGSDPIVVGSRNPVDRIVSHDWNGDNAWTDQDLNGDGDMDDPGERETAFALQVKDAPRPLVNAAWLDSAIIFHADGTAEYAEWNRARRSYTAVPDPSPALADNQFGSGIPDRAKPGAEWLYSPLTNATGGICKYEIGEVGHFTAHTGGWHITLAPDSLDDRADFASAKEAMESITPAWRVFVSRAGTVSSFRVMNRTGYLKPLVAAGKVWPMDPAAWLDTSGAGSNQVFNHCRVGFLHEPTSWEYATLVPLGKPITTILDPDMMARRVWWTLP